MDPNSFLRTYMDTMADRNRKSIPVSSTRREILSDPFLSSSEKAQALTVLDGTQPSGLISWNDVVRGAVGAGVGYVAGDLFGRTLFTVFGRIEPKTQRALKNTGIAAGILRGTGVLR